MAITDLDAIKKRLREIEDMIRELNDEIGQAKCGSCGAYAINDKERNKANDK